MPLLSPGGTFPELTLNVPGSETVTVPDTFAGHFGVVLFYRGAWCPYCNAEHGLTFPVGFGADGRLVPADVAGLVRYLREHAATSA